MSQLSPLLLQAQISPPAGGGSFGLADTTRLENPFQGPMWLDEIRFRLPSPEEFASEAQGWSSLKIELKLGDIPLTNGFVPISLFGKTLNSSLTAEVNTSNVGPSLFTWRLPRPLYIPSRELLRPTMYLEPYPSAPAKVVTIIYCCRPIPPNTPPPQTLQVPWVTYFKPPSQTEPFINDVLESTPADLYNPWEEELHVQRFVGRFMPRNFGDDQNFMSLVSANVNQSTGLITNGTLVSAQDSSNNILIRDRTPFGHVFDFLDHAWTVNCILPSKGFYLFTVERLWDGYSPADTVTATVGISMIGWREVEARRHYDIRNAQPLGPPTVIRRGGR